MVLKKVLLGFATTTLFILLVMIAPTAAAATTASLQQQDDNATTIDEPNIPIGPADEGPDEPIPNNENRTDDDDNVTDDDDDLPIACALAAGNYDEECPPIRVNIDPDTWINWVKVVAKNNIDYNKKIHDGAGVSAHYFKIDFQSDATDTGDGSHVDGSFDGRDYYRVASPHYFSIQSNGYHTIKLKGVDKYGNEDPTPAKFTIIITKKRAYPPSDDDGNPETWINSVRATPRGVNIANGGSTSSSTVIIDFQGTVAGKGSHIDLKIDNGPYKPVASPHKIPGLSDGPHTIYLKAVNQAGKADPTPAQWRFIVINDSDD